MSERRRQGRGRSLRPDEQRLWETVAERVAPRLTVDKAADQVAATPDDDPPAETSFPADIEIPAPEAPRLPRRALAIRQPKAPQVTFTFASDDAGPVGRPQAGLDRRTADRLRKGARDPDARIDLHGMTADRAHSACLRFLGDAVGRGHRVVLVITGKGAGRGSDGFACRGGGVLRESLSGWLRASPLAPSIVGIYQAHQKHGGTGAFYVYLKKRR